MSAKIKRRDFVSLLGGAAAAWPLAARAQQAAKLPTIGYLGANSSSAESQRVAAFMQRLRELGWIESRNVTIEYRYAEGPSERFAEFAAEFVRLNVDVIVTSGTPAVIAAKQATSLIPMPPSMAPTEKEASGCCACKSTTNTKFASSSEAGHERIADAFACGGDRGAGLVLFNPGLPSRC